MANVLQPTNSNRENLDAFIDTIEDEDLRQFVRDHLQTVLAVGRQSQERERQMFFTALQAIVDRRIGEAGL